VNLDDQHPLADDPLADDFDRPATRGTAIGPATRSAHRRGGVDVEGVVAVDDGGARLSPLARPGWGRVGIAYGAWPPEAGLTFSVHVLNGHNGAQDRPRRSRPRLVARWVLGSGTDPWWRRVPRLLHHTGRESTLHRLARYRLLDRTHPATELDTQNLAIGWFDAEAGRRPHRQPGALIVAGAAGDSGALAIIGEDGPAVVRERLGELPMHVVAVLRDAGVALFAAVGVDDGHRPLLRPVGIVATPLPATVWAGVHQRIMGEIGFSPDTRVYAARVARVGTWSRWWTTAVAADRLVGDASLEQHAAETGQRWAVSDGGFTRTASGLALRPGVDHGDRVALLDAGVPVGLLRTVLRTGKPDGDGVALHWRLQDPETSWRLRLGATSVAVERWEAGVITARWSEEPPTLGALRPPTVASDRDVEVVVVDDGCHVSVTVDGRPVHVGPIADRTLADNTTVGIGPLGTGWTIRDLEAHPRTIALPPELDIAPRRLAPGRTRAWVEDFELPPGDLVGSRGPGGTWERTLGDDAFGVEPGCARVIASPTAPARGRTLYTLPWDRPDFADLAVTVVPPGQHRSEDQRGRGGIVLWQDPASYLIVNTWLDDAFVGSSISVFSHLDGFEDVLDAVWVNVGARIRWGVPYRLRVVCDGDALLIYADGSPVLYRRLADVVPEHPHLDIRRVGLAVNWEWGTDTGTTFRHFEARHR
jgi:hypothetical protein